MAESDLFERGLQVRRDVLGAEYIDANSADTDEFMMAFQRVVGVGIRLEQARSGPQDAQHAESCDADCVGAA